MADSFGGIIEGTPLSVQTNKQNIENRRSFYNQRYWLSMTRDNLLLQTPEEKKIKTREIVCQTIPDISGVQFPPFPLPLPHALYKNYVALLTHKKF